MCDYSLAGLPNRLAREGEQLVVHRFRTGSIGLASVADLSVRTASAPSKPRPKGFWKQIASWFEAEPVDSELCAVCIPPGARLVLTSVPDEVRDRWSVSEGTSVLFAQTSATVNNYRDAFVMPDGKPVLLQCLPEGLRVTVLTLGGSEQSLASPNPYSAVGL